MGCSPEKVENPAASRSPDRHRWQAPPDPRLKPRKNTHFHLLKDASHTLRMEQPRPLDGSKVQTLVNITNTCKNAITETSFDCTLLRAVDHSFDGVDRVHNVAPFCQSNCC